MFGQSSPAAVLVGGVAGILGGEIGRAIARSAGGGDTAQRIATGVGHSLAHAAAGWTVNALGGFDVTGGAITSGTSLVGGLLHAQSIDCPSSYDIVIEW